MASGDRARSVDGETAKKIHEALKAENSKEFTAKEKTKGAGEFRDGVNAYDESQKESAKKLPTYGDKVQQGFIGYVKKQTGIDLTPARDTYFDNKKGFNIDTRKLKPNQLNEIKRLVQKYPGGYKAEFGLNGAYRVRIGVSRPKKR